MIVKNWMTKDPICCPKETYVMEAVEIMAERGVGSIIVAEHKMLESIFTERDLLKRVIAKDLDPKSTMLVDVMTHNPDTIRPIDDIVVAFRCLLNAHYRHLPVTNMDGIVEGIISVNTPHLADLLVVAEYHLGKGAKDIDIQRVIGKDFEEELDAFAREEYGTKVYKSYRDKGTVDQLKNHLREEFKTVYQERTGSKIKE